MNHLIECHSDDVRASVLAELADLFKTVRGSMPGEPEYGVLDVRLVYESRFGAAAVWCRDTQIAIQRFVPRLRSARVVQVKIEERIDLAFRLGIHGRIELNGRFVPIDIGAQSDRGQGWRLR